MKCLPIVLLASAVFLLPLNAATEAPQNGQTASELAGERGLNPGTTDTEQSASELAGERGLNPGTTDTEQSASQLAEERGLNPGTKDTEESASQLADETLGAIPAGQNLETAQQLADERDGVSPSPTPGSPASAGSTVGPETGINGTVYAAAVEESGQVIVVGQFTQVDSQTRTNIARLNADGTLDKTFLAKATDGLNGPAYAVAIDAKGGILVGGTFSEAQITPVSNFVRYQHDGTLDKAFSSKTKINGKVLAVAVQNDGTIVIGGEFSEVGTQQRRNIARFNPDGSIADPIKSSATMSGTVRSLAALPNGGVIAGGSFEVPGQTRKNVLMTSGKN